MSGVLHRADPSRRVPHDQLTARSPQPHGHDVRRVRRHLINPERTGFAIDLASALRALPSRTPDQLDELIELQLEIVSALRGLGESAWTRAAKLLGDAYQGRAAWASPQAREEYSTAALEQYQSAFASMTPRGASRLRVSMQIANTSVLLASLRGNGAAALGAAAALIADSSRAGHE